MGHSPTPFVSPAILDDFAARYAGDLAAYGNSLMHGLAGVALVSAHLSRGYLPGTEGHATYTGLASRTAEELLRRLRAGEWRLGRVHSLCSGLAGVLYAIDELNRLGVLTARLDAETRLALQEVMTGRALEDVREGNVDYLHGPLGVFLVLLRDREIPEVSHMLDRIFAAYRDHCVRDARGCRCYNSVLRGQAPAEEYNFGLAHGLAGHVIILARAYAAGYRPAETEALLREQLRYVESYRREPGPGADRSTWKYYPKSVVENDPDWWDGEDGSQTYESRVGYCYGDLNVAFAYLTAGRVLADPTLSCKGLDLARHTARRLDVADTQIGINPHFCHGSAGLVYMFGVLERATGEELFGQTAAAWQAHFRYHYYQPLFLDLPADRQTSLLEGELGAVLAQIPQLQPGNYPLADALLLDL